MGTAWRRTAIALVGLLLLVAADARAQLSAQAGSVPAGTVPGGINYQGRLMDNGFPVTGTRSVRFRLYDAASGGTLLWSSAVQSIVVTQGVFGTTLSLSTGPLSGPAQKYLEVQVDNTTLSPREPLNAVPYALVAKSLEDQVTIENVTVGTQLISSGTLTVTTIGALPGGAGVRVSTSVIVESANPQLQLRNTSSVLPAGLYRWAAPGDYVTLEKNGSGAGDWSALSELLRLTSAGSLGLGTGAPGYKLDVQGGQINASGGLCIAGVCQTGWAGVSGVTGAGTTGYVVKWTGGSTIGNSVLVEGAGGMTVAGASTLTVAGSAFSVGGATFVVTSGNVGIGTTSPSSLLHISTAINALAGGQVTNSDSGAAAAARWVISGNNGNVSVEQMSAGYVGTGARSADSAVINSGGLGSLNLAAASAAPNSAIKFYTSGNAAANERLRIDNVGNVGIGTTSPATLLDVAGAAQFGLGVSKSTFTAAGRLTFPAGYSPTVALEAATKGYVDNSVSAASPLLASTNTWSAQQTFLNQLTISTGATISGNVGIGTTNPPHRLVVSGADSDLVYLSNANAGLELRSTPATSSQYIDFTGGSTGEAGSGTPDYEGRILYNSPNDYMAVYTAAVERLRVDSAGNAGVGTTAPAARLHVSSANAAAADTILQVSSGAASGQELMVVKGNGRVGIGTANPAALLEVDVSNAGTFRVEPLGGAGVQLNNPNGYLTLGAAGGVTMNPGGSELVRVDPTGFVGIGNAAPTHRLHATLGAGTPAANGGHVAVFENLGAGSEGRVAILAPAEQTLAFGTSANQSLGLIKYLAASNALTLTSNSAERVRIDSGGNLGIGTTSPASKLHVLDGDIRVSTSAGQPSKGIIFQDGSVQTTAAGGTGGGWTDTGSVVQLVTPTDTISSAGAGLTVSTHLIVSAGNVGIGTTVPGSILHAVGSGSPELRVQSTGGMGRTLAIASEDLGGGGFSFIDRTAGARRWAIDANGNMAISPNQIANVGPYPGGLNVAGDLRVAAGIGAAPVLYVSTTSGNVGIGATNPKSSLEIKGQSGQIFDVTGGSPGQVNWRIGGQVLVDKGFEITPSAGVGNFTFTNPALVIKNDGNVGIGTTSPAVRLQVAGIIASSPTVSPAEFQSFNPAFGNTYRWSHQSDGALRIVKDPGNVTYLDIENNGNVGIGTTSPAAKLHVDGNIIGGRTVEYWSADRTGGVASTVWTSIPGLSLSINLSRGATVQITASGEARALVFDATSCHQAYRLVVDGAPRGDPTHGQRLQVLIRDRGWWQPWSFSDSAALPAGAHTISVQTRESSAAAAMCMICAEGDGALPGYTACHLSAAAFYQ